MVFFLLPEKFKPQNGYNTRPPAFARWGLFVQFFGAFDNPESRTL